MEWPVGILLVVVACGRGLSPLSCSLSIRSAVTWARFIGTEGERRILEVRGLDGGHFHYIYPLVDS